jgi:hypothetical protein
MMRKVTVPYDHDPESLATIYLGISASAREAPTKWRPAYRDTVDGQRVVWARFKESGQVWIRDDGGERLVRTRRAR